MTEKFKVREIKISQNLSASIFCIDGVLYILDQDTLDEITRSMTHSGGE